jgi:hypothetical protein
MFSFAQYLTEASAGQLTAHRGRLNEMAFVHAFERYNALMQKHNGDHEAAMKELSNEPHLVSKDMEKNHPYRGMIDRISKDIGHKEADRTLWDSHHAAMSVINHIHNEHGGISGPAQWTGGDNSGETVRKLTGVNTQGDILIPTRSGGNVVLQRPDKKSSKNDWISGSMKYHGTSKKTPTKLYQGTTDEAVEAVQNHHVRNFGKRDEELDAANAALKSSFGDTGERLKSRSKELTAAGFQPKQDGSFAVGPTSDMTRYANELLSLRQKDEKKKTEKDRIRESELHGRLEEHFNKASVPYTERDGHLQNMASVYNDAVKGDKTKASKGFASAFNNALQKSYTEGKTGQAKLLRDLINVRENRNANVLIMKTQRNDKVDDYRGREQEALPEVYIGNHAKALSGIQDRARKEGRKENELFDTIGPKADSASTTINARNGDKIASFNIDTAKSSPSLIAQAGPAIDKFESISHLHPWQNQTQPTEQKPTPMQIASQRVAAKKPVAQAPASTKDAFSGTDSPVAGWTGSANPKQESESGPSNSMFGKSFHAAHELE